MFLTFLGADDLLRLMLLNGEARGVRFEVSGGTPVFIGRHAMGVDHVDARMSRQHAEVWLEGGVWLLRDLQSTNGTFVNGKRVHGLCELELGDHLRCGRTEFVVADLQIEAGDIASPAEDPHASGESSGDTAVAAEVREPVAPSPADGFRRTHGGEARAIISTAIGADENPSPSSGVDAPETASTPDGPDVSEAAGPAEAPRIFAALETPQIEAASPQPEARGPEAITFDVDIDVDGHGASDGAAGPDDASAHADDEPVMELSAAPAIPDLAEDLPSPDELMDSLAPAPPEVSATPDVSTSPDARTTSEVSQGTAAQDDTADRVSLTEDNRDLPSWGRKPLRGRHEKPADDKHASVPLDDVSPEESASGESAPEKPSAQPSVAASAPTERDDTPSVSDAPVEPVSVEHAEDEPDEYAAPQVVGLSLGHAPPAPSEPAPASDAPPLPSAAEDPTDLLAIEADAVEEDSSADAPTPDNVQVSDGAVASAEVAPPTPDDPELLAEDPAPASEPPAPPVSEDEDDDVLKLGFTGTDRPREPLDEPALRGEVASAAPGRFVVIEDDEPDPAVHADPTAAHAGEAVDRFERRALLADEPTTDTTDTDEDADARPSRVASDRTHRRLPVVLVGLAVMAFVVGVIGYAWHQQQQQSVTGRSPSADPANAKANANADAAPADHPKLTVDNPAPAAVPADDPAPAAGVADNPLIRPGSTPGLTADATPATDAAASAATRAQNDTASSDIAFGTGPSLVIPPTPAATSANPASPAAAQSPTPAEATAPARVATSDELAAIVAAAQARRTHNAAPPTPDPDAGSSHGLSEAKPRVAPTDPAGSPTRPPAVAGTAQPGPITRPQTSPDTTDPATAFAWSGLSVGNDDNIFTTPAPAPSDDSSRGPSEVKPRINPATAPAAPAVVTSAAPSSAAVAPAIAALSTRNVVYLVDTSGTMVDSMPQLRAYLADAIDRLAPDQKFTVVLFRQGEAIELPDAGLRSATAAHKTAARRWLSEEAGNIRLGGRSDPTVALRRVLNYGVQDVVVFSDDTLGKRVKPGGADLTLDDLAAVFAGHDGVQLHAVQFFHDDARNLLRRLADRFDGDYQFVREVTNANPDAPDILGSVDAR